jgi:hypothetical protein
LGSFEGCRTLGRRSKTFGFACDRAATAGRPERFPQAKAHFGRDTSHLRSGEPQAAQGMREGLRLLPRSPLGTNCRLTSNAFPLKLQITSHGIGTLPPVPEETISGAFGGYEASATNGAKSKLSVGAIRKPPGTGISERVAAAAEIASCLFRFSRIRCGFRLGFGYSPSRID